MSVSLDKIPEPSNFWFEDADGKKIEWNIYNSSFPHNWAEMHSKNLLIQYSIHFNNLKRTQDHWIVRFLNLVLEKLPRSWKAHNNLKFESGINHSYWLVKYLVEQRKFSFWHACVVASDMCSRCQNICEAEISNTANNKVHETNVCCHYCKFIDPGYLEQRRIRMCYLAYKNNLNVKEIWDHNSDWIDK